MDYIEAKHPGVKVNRISFSVAYYTIRKKLGIGGGKPRGRKAGAKTRAVRQVGSLDMAGLQAAAKLLREVGSAEAAIEAIKSVQTIQIQ